MNPGRLDRGRPGFKISFAHVALWGNRCHLDLKLDEAHKTVQAVVARQTRDQSVEVREARWKDTCKEAKAMSCARRVHRSSTCSEEIGNSDGAKFDRPRCDIYALLASDTAR